MIIIRFLGIWAFSSLILEEVRRNCNGECWIKILSKQLAGLQLFHKGAEVPFIHTGLLMNLALRAFSIHEQNGLRPGAL